MSDIDLAVAAICHRQQNVRYRASFFVAGYDLDEAHSRHLGCDIHSPQAAQKLRSRTI